MTIKRKCGDTIPLELYNVKGLDGAVVTSFTGWELWFTVKTDSSQAEPGILQKTKSGGGITTTGGQANWEITSTESRTLFLPGTTYEFDVQGRDPLGRIGTLDEGKITLSDDITKST